MANRKRPVCVKFRVTEEEVEKIRMRMDQMKTSNREAYVRKMAIDGAVVNLQIPGLKELVGNMRIYSKRLNEITKRVNSTDRIYPEDISEIKTMLSDILKQGSGVLDEFKNFQ